MNNNIRLAEKIIEVFFVSIFLIIICVNIGFIFSLSFKITSYLSSIILIFYLSIFFIKNKIHKNLKTILKLENLIFILLSLIVGLIITSINRYSGDDGAYYAKAIHYLNNPDNILDYSIPWVAEVSDNAKILVPSNFEISQATIAWLIGVEFLTISHIVFPIILGFCLFQSIYLLLSIVEKDKFNILFYSVAVIFFYFILSDSSRSHGIYGLSRIHQGKSIVMFFGLYTWSYFSYQFLLKSDLLKIIFLIVLSVTLSEISTTAFFYIPFLSFIIFVSFHISKNNSNLKNLFKSGIRYFLCLLPLFLKTLSFKLSLSNNFKSNYEKFPNSFFDQFDLVYGSNLYFILFFLLSFGLFFSRYKEKNFFILWLIITIVIFLNPFISNFLSMNLTTNAFYWRLFYLIPVPFFMIFFLDLILNLKIFKFKKIYSFVVIIFLMISFARFSPTSILNQSGVKFLTYEYNLTPVSQLVVKRFEKNYKKGSMVSDPKWFTVPFVLLSSNYPQYFWEPAQMLIFDTSSAWTTEVELRKKAMQYLYGGKKFLNQKDYLIKFFEKNCPKYVLQDIDNRKKNIEEATEIIKKFNYKVYNQKKSIHPDIKVWESNCK